MPHSWAEMQREIEGLSGEGFLFSVFPTETVKANMKAGHVVASTAEVERLWLAYQRATVGNGLAPYSKDGGGAVAGPLLQYMEKDTGYARMTIAAFLNALERAVKVNGWDWKWLDPAAARETGEPMTAGESVANALKSSGEAVGGFLKPVADPVTNVIKYAAIALVAGAVIYGVYQGTNAVKLFKKRRKR